MNHSIFQHTLWNHRLKKNFFANFSLYKTFFTFSKLDLWHEADDEYEYDDEDYDEADDEHDDDEDDDENESDGEDD